MRRKIAFKNQFLVFLFVVVLSTLFSFVFCDSKIEADVVTPASARLSSVKSADSANHIIYFVLPSGVSGGEQIQITYPGSSFVFGSLYDFNDMSLEMGSTGNCNTASYSAKTIAGTPSGGVWGATYSSNTVTFLSGSDTITAGRCVRVTLFSNGTNHTLINPTVTTNTVYNVDIVSTDDFGDLAIIILGDVSDPNPDEVLITSQVFPSILLGIDTVLNDCDNATTTTPANQVINFGTVLPNILYSSGSTHEFICVSAGTNTVNGMRVLVQSARNNAQGGLVSGANVIASSTADLNVATSGYGLRISSVGTPSLGSFTATSPFDSVTPGSVGGLNGLLGTPTEIFSSSSPARTATLSRVGIEVSVKTNTSIGQGTYTDTIFFTAFTKL